MNADARAALTRLGAAYAELGRVLSLPAEIGARVQWRVNGVIWTRVGEDEWAPASNDVIPADLDELRAGGWTAPSSHIASDAGWTTEIDETAGGRR